MRAHSQSENEIVVVERVKATAYTVEQCFFRGFARFSAPFEAFTPLRRRNERASERDFDIFNGK